ncbi:MAG: KpsF/GutQ family sugar-phosphate isomerase [Bacteroidales bacterium]|nr:KpsF/GutQ family sugar-phosphate isomerase [Bacteroidales bacterium]
MSYTRRAKEIVEQQIGELKKMQQALGEEFDRAVEMIYACQGKTVVMGIGKTGTIGHKIASSMASTGTTAIFINAAEAMHGDLGMLNTGDVVVLISNSGSSQEILNVIAPVKRIGCPIIGITGNTASPLAREAAVVLNVHVDEEACPLGLAPTTSTTATLVMGDALTICLMEKRNFKAENYALYHPGGALGRKLLVRVRDKMTTDIPRVTETTTFKDLIYEVSNKRLGMTVVVDAGGAATGIITDGDIRRAVQGFDDIKSLTAGDFMTRNFKSIAPHQLLTEALDLMDASNITTLPVIDEGRVEGIISIHHIIDFK